MHIPQVITDLGALQKLRNGQRVDGVDDFVTFRYVYLRGKEYFMK